MAISSGAPGDEIDGLAIDQLAGADLRPGQVLQDGDVPAGPGRGVADAGDDGAVLLVRAVREIEAEDVGARGDERVERALGGTGRPDGGDDLGESAHEGSSRAVNPIAGWPRLTSWLAMLPEWFDTARADAERRGLGHIVPVLEALRASGERLRQAAWAEHATARIALRGAALAPAADRPAPARGRRGAGSREGAADHRRDRRQAPFGRRLGVVAGRGGPRRPSPATTRG